MYEYELFKSRERELHGRAAARRLAREAAAAGRGGERTGLVARAARAVRAGRRGAAAPQRAKSGAEQGRSGAVAGCAG
ncbi:hypothetical protein [Kitasatospora sp. NPDC090308]|uniref:hypothetical protein n=1 Tax=Kitasatospora sp. NPDC090308 TaxID=3364082 RepID=UPI00381E3AD2